MDKDKLLSNIWKTKKSRINTSERYKKTAEFIATINIYYSLMITAISLYLIKYPNDNISLILVVISICLTVSIVFMGNKRYEERAKDLKNNYISLNKLYNQAKLGNMDIMEINNKYNDLLDACENQNEYDYFKFMWYDKTEKLSKNETIIYIMTTFKNIIIKISIVVFPIIVLIPFLPIMIENLFKLSRQ
ncbi:MAG: SLATT domain-containing protein [Cellulosilyticaceae bacterium]